MIQSLGPYLYEQNASQDGGALRAYLSPYHSSTLKIYCDVCIYDMKANAIIKSSQIGDEVNIKVDNIVCVKRPEHSPLRPHNRSQLSHIKGNLNTRLQ